MKNSLNLGNGIIFEDGDIKGTKEVDDTWMTWDEEWQWVIDSLRKIEEFEKYNKKED